jgi:hypothetical protein
VRSLDPSLPHPEEARPYGEVIAGRAGADHRYGVPFHLEDGDGEGGLAGMFARDVDILAADAGVYIAPGQGSTFTLMVLDGSALTAAA